MTDETVLDGKQMESGEKGSQPQSSAPDAQPSADVAALQKELNELKKLYNGIKKSEDTINTRVEQRVSELTSHIGRIAELAKAGKSESEIEERLLLDQILQERKGSLSPTPTEGTEQRGQGQVDVQEIAKQLNLDVNDKDIADAVATGNLVNVMKVAMSKANTPSPGPEDSPPILGGSGNREKSPAQLEADYQKELATIAQSTRGEHKLRAITDLKEKYRKAGLPKL
jgi:hypothetical protein